MLQAELWSIASRAFPSLRELPYYEALFASQLSYEQSMKAQLQDLARAVSSHDLRDLQRAKLAAAVAEGRVRTSCAERLFATIDDEDQTAEHASHYQIRLQIFDGAGFTRHQLETAAPVQETQTASATFRSVFELGSITDICVAVGAVEAWYASIAPKIGEALSGLGYTDHQLETYRIHSAADDRHASEAFEFAATYSSLRTADMAETARRAFDSVKLYDQARFRVAFDSTMGFASYLRLE